MCSKRPSTLPMSDAPENKMAKEDTSSSELEEERTVRQKLKESLMALTSSSEERSGDFCTGAVLCPTELPNLPLIDIKKYGVLPLPINKSVYTELATLYQNSPCGRGKRKSKGEYIGNSFQLDAEHFCITNKSFDCKLAAFVESRVKTCLGLVDSPY